MPKNNEENEIDYASDPEARDRLLQAFTQSVEELLRAPKECLFLVERLLPAQGVVLIVGEPGGGKSWVAYDLIRAVATGTPWLDRTAAAAEGKPQSCVLFDYDNGWGEIGKRFYRLGFKGPEPVRTHVSDQSPAALFVPSNEQEFCGVIDAAGARLVVFDSLRAGAEGDESSSADMRKVMWCFKSAAKKLNCLVVVLHHTPKGEVKSGGWQNRARGSGEIVASADVVIEVAEFDPEKQSGELYWSKARGWDPGKDRRLHFSLVDEGERTVVRATGSVPGVSRDEENLRALLRVIPDGEIGIGLAEAQEAMKATREAVAEAVGLGVARGVLEEYRVDRNSQKKAIRRKS